jgi:hypothetical protein
MENLTPEAAVAVREGTARRVAPGRDAGVRFALEPGEDQDAAALLEQIRAELGELDPCPPVLIWLDAEPAVFGLHFAGANVETNTARAVVARADQLRVVGVPVAEPGDD